jgi:N-acetyl-anhydromuramyl-L-alanine amidase AmpD
MPMTFQIRNRYMHYEYVVGAAVTFDDETVTAKTPRSRVYGYVTVQPELLKDGEHMMHIIPSPTSDQPVGPAVAEGLAENVTRIYRSLSFKVQVQKGKLTSYTVPLQLADNGTVEGPPTSMNVKLQPVYFRSPWQTPSGRKTEEIKHIVIHQTASDANMSGTLKTMTASFKELKGEVGSANYVISADASPQIVKVVQDNGKAWHLGKHGYWGGDKDIVGNSIGIEMSHKTGTPWPEKQIATLLKFLNVLLKTYPSIKPERIVGHSDALTTGEYVLVDRDCPGMDFDWPVLEKEGLGVVPRRGSASLDTAYGGFFQLNPDGSLFSLNNDKSRRWGKQTWPTPPAIGSPAPDGPPTVTGNPIQELQTDLRDIGYSVDVNGVYDPKTVQAVFMFQKHFFAGSRRGLRKTDRDAQVGRATAEMIKRVRP